MSEWTPGEWLLVDKTVYALDEQGKVNRFSVLLNGGHVNSGSRHAFGDAVVRTTDAELAANAHLIAAAPDLYEALEALERQCVALYRAATPGGNYGTNAEGSDRNESAFADNDPAVSDARKALAKARGEA